MESKKSFLKNLENFCITTAVPFRTIPVPVEFLPDILVKGMISKNKEISQDNAEITIKECSLNYGAEDFMYLKVLFSNGSILNVIQQYVDFSNDIKGYQIDEPKIIAYSEKIDYQKYQKLITEYDLSSRWFIPKNKVTSLDAMLNTSRSKIEDYIRYLNDEYLEKLESDYREGKLR